jgi:hypothetical protein
VCMSVLLKALKKGSTSTSQQQHSGITGCSVLHVMAPTASMFSGSILSSGQGTDMPARSSTQSQVQALVHLLERAGAGACAITIVTPIPWDGDNQSKDSRVHVVSALLGAAWDPFTSPPTLTLHHLVDLALKGASNQTTTTQPSSSKHGGDGTKDSTMNHNRALHASGAAAIASVSDRVTSHSHLHAAAAKSALARTRATQSGAKKPRLSLLSLQCFPPIHSAQDVGEGGGDPGTCVVWEALHQLYLQVGEYVLVRSNPGLAGLYMIASCTRTCMSAEAKHPCIATVVCLVAS